MIYALLKTTALVATVLGVLGIGLIAANWSFVQHRLQLLKPASNYWPNHAVANLDKRCAYVDKSLYACEDIVVHDNYAYLACGTTQESRMEWYPPLAHRDPNAKPPTDQFYVYDFTESTLTKMHILRLPGDGQLTLHGISVHPASKPGKLIIGAVNHLKAGSCVDLFDHRIGTDELIFTERICDPKLYAPNDLILTSPTSFYATNFLSPEGTASRWAASRELLFGLPSGSIVYRGQDRQMRVVREAVRAANGIQTLGNNQLVVSETSAGELSFFDIQADHSLRSAGPPLRLPMSPDNLSIDPVTGALVVTGPASTWAFFRAERANFNYAQRGVYRAPSAGSKKKGKGPDASSPLGPPIPSAVLLVSNSTKGFGRFLGEKYAVTPVLVDKLGDFIYGASIAAVHAGSKKALLGGPMMRGVVACDWVDKIPASGGSGSGDKAAAAEKGKSKVKEEL